MNHPAYTTGTLCRTLSADHNTMINALNSLYSFIPPSLSIKLTSRSLSKLKFWPMIKTLYYRFVHFPKNKTILGMIIFNVTIDSAIMAKLTNLGIIRCSAEDN